MKITSIETFASEWVALVRVRTDEGARGLGPGRSVLRRHHRAGPPPAGRAARARRGTRSTSRRSSTRSPSAEHKFPGSYLYRALAGVDTALWDLRGKLEGKSVCELLGGTPRPRPGLRARACAATSRRGTRPSGSPACSDEHGYTAFKFRVGKECGHDEDEWPGRTEAVVAAVRQALGDDVALLVDANSCYTPAKAIEVGRMLEEHGVCHFEEPCPYWELEWTREVAAALDARRHRRRAGLLTWRSGGG